MHYKRDYVSSLGRCKAESCNKPAFNKGGLCGAHYAKMRKYGRYDCGVRTPNGEPSRFIEKALSYRGDECLIWPFARDANGYGRFRDKEAKKTVTVSAYVCQKVLGQPPFTDAEAAHSCGKGHLGCVSPSHLSWKTRTENMGDMVLHGTSLRGTRSPHSKLTEDDVREILRLKGELLQREIAKLFGVHKETVGAIHRGERWGWLT